MILRYVPPIKTGLKAFVVISFFAVALGLYLAFVQWGFATVIVFSFLYAVLMATFFISLSNKHFIELDEEANKVTIHKLFSFIEIAVEKISVIDLVETKRAYILSISTEEATKDFSLSGSLSFEEPPLLPFIRKLHKIKPTIGFGDYCIGILHGEANFNPWSSKMYYTYWTYMGILIGYYLFLLLFLQIVK